MEKVDCRLGMRIATRQTVGSKIVSQSSRRVRASRFQLLSDVQIYHDLQRAGLRPDEQAEELKRWPDFAGWA
jgi:hypothetical protein